jgi:hypothetical protein
MPQQQTMSEDGARGIRRYHSSMRLLNCSILATFLTVLQLPFLQSNPITFHHHDKREAYVGSSAFVSQLVPATLPLRMGPGNVAKHPRLHFPTPSLASSFGKPIHSVKRPLYEQQQGRCTRSGVFSRTVMQTSSMFGAESIDVAKGDRTIIVGVDIKKDK